MPQQTAPPRAPFYTAIVSKLYRVICTTCRSQWPRGQRRRSAAARLLGVWVLIPPGAWMSVCWECCVFSGRGLCDELITRPEESYRLWCVWVWSRNLVNEEALAHWGLLCQKKKKIFTTCNFSWFWESFGLWNILVNRSKYFPYGG